MKNISRKDILGIILFEIGFGLTIKLVGSISISELFLILFTFIRIFSDTLIKNKEFRFYTTLYILLFIFQSISEIIVGNSIGNSLKGVAITIVSFCHFYFLVHIFSKNRGIITWVILGMILKSLVFGSAFEGDAESALGGEDATFLKFFLAPLIINCLLFLYLKNKVKNIAAIFILTGVFFVVAGARSYGLMSLVTGLTTWMLSRKKLLKKQQLLSYTIPCLIIGYVLYVIYVNNVLSGNITSGNNEQLLLADDPYNPIYLLLAGRTEVFTGWIAFMDAPLLGHGSWAQDPGYHYHHIVSLFHDKEFSFDVFSGANVIPTHSVLIGYGTFNGILPFIILLLIMIRVFKQAFYSLRFSDSLQIVHIFFITQLFWNLIFSPLSHFRQTLPLYMAFIFVTYMVNIQKAKA